MTTPNQPQNNAIARNKEKQTNLKSMLMQGMSAVQGVASKRLDPEKLVRIALVAASRNQRLLDCSPQSILSALMQAASCGLEPETPLQHAYLIPRKNKHTQTLEATFLPSYKGLILLATRGDVQAIWSRVVYVGEYFDVKYGSDERLEHTPNFDDEQSDEVRCVYACAKLKSGVVKFEVMSVAQIEKIRQRASAGGRESPWDTDWEEMAKKTTIRRLCKTLPTSDEYLANAIAIDEASESGDEEAPRGRRRGASADVIPIMTEAMDDGSAAGAAREQTRAEKTAATLKAKKEKAAAEGKPPSEEDTVSLRKPGQATLSLDEQEQIKREERDEASRESKGRAPGEDDDEG